MRILEKKRSDFLSHCETWRVQPETIETEFQINIVGPEGTWPAETKFGVVFALDAEFFGNIVPSMARTLAAFGDVYPIYTVTIGYPEGPESLHTLQRTRDLTPTEYPEYAHFIATTMEAKEVSTGQAESFLSFITNELKPALAGAFPLDLEDTILAGHDLGGLFTLYALLKKPDSFKNYIGLSPALWWDNAALMSLAEKSAPPSSSFNAGLYMCGGALGTLNTTSALIAELPEPLRDEVPSGMLDSDILGNLQRMEEALSPWTNHGLTIKLAMIANETQGSVIGAGLSQGLRSILSMPQSEEDPEKA